jgi:hypothetical protein
MKLDASGNLGLGVTPSAWGYGGNFNLEGGGRYIASKSDDTRYASNVYNDGSNELYSSNGFATRYRQANGIHSWVTAPSGTAGNAISFTQAMTLNASGNLSLGNTNDTYKLDVTGSVRITGNIGINGVAPTYPLYVRVGTDQRFRVVDGGSGYTQLASLNDAEGSYTPIMIGNSWLSLAFTGAATFSSSVTTGSDIFTYNNGGIFFSGAASYTSGIFQNAVGLNLQTGGSPKLTITSGGNVGIGTTSPFGKLSVYSQTIGTPAIFASSNVSGDLSYPGIRVDKYDNNSSTSQVFINFSIANNTVANGQINGNGSGAVAFGSWSDIRLKENIENLSSQLANIMALRPVEFDYIQSEGGGKQIGFIAQEMQNIYPDAVGKRVDGMLTVTGWSKTEARLVKAIQELKQELDTLKNK